MLLFRYSKFVKKYWLNVLILSSKNAIIHENEIICVGLASEIDIDIIDNIDIDFVITLNITTFY